jgi:hypothetical protein
VAVLSHYSTIGPTYGIQVCMWEGDTEKRTDCWKIMKEEDWWILIAGKL